MYKQYLGRELTAAETYVFDSAIKIMIWKVHGKHSVKYAKKDMLMFQKLQRGVFCRKQDIRKTQII